MEKEVGKKKRRRMLRTVRFSVKFPEKYELLPEKETSFVQRGWMALTTYAFKRSGTNFRSARGGRTRARMRFFAGLKMLNGN